MPTFSVIVPFYNVEKYIAQCIESILAQTFADFELLCVDDCATDNSANIIKNYRKKDKRIQLIQYPTNKGVGGARNTGIEAAKGKYIVFIDSDDWVEPNCLEKLYEAFQKYQTNSIWYDAFLFDEQTQTRKEGSATQNKEGFLHITPKTICNYTDYVMKAYLRSSIVDNNIKYPESLTFEDGEFYIKYFSLNPDCYILEDCLYNYRINRPGSIVTSTREGHGKFEDIFQVVRNIRQFYIDNNLYDKYKYTLMQIINLRINTCRNISNSYERSLPIAKALLEEFGYPNEFLEFKQTSPKFTIVVPFYNVEAYIEQCLNSIKHQTFSDFEVLCVDDCGQDKSRSIVEKYVSNDSRFRIITHEHNKGLGAARNTAINEAKGEYLVFVDSDDWLDIRALEILSNKINETKYNTIWFKVNIWWEESKRMTDMCNFKFYADFPEGYHTINDDLLAKFPTSTWNKVYNREFMLKNKFYYPEGVLFEDVEIYFKTTIAAPDIYLIDKPLYYYRRRNDSIIGTCIRDAQKAKDVFKVAFEVDKYLKENNFLQKYPKSSLRFIVDIVNDFRYYEEVQKQLLPIIKDYLDNINFPDDYVNL